MEESKKKPIMIAIVVACLVLAGTITYITSSGGSGGIDSIKRGEMVWVKCSNPDCVAEYQMGKRDYYEYIEEHQVGMSNPALVCKECGEETVYRAEKCPECGAIFFLGSVRGDYQDRCPECGYSKTEQMAEKAKKARQGK